VLVIVQILSQADGRRPSGLVPSRVTARSSVKDPGQDLQITGLSAKFWALGAGSSGEFGGSSGSVTGERGMRAQSERQPEEISMSPDQLSGTTAIVTGASRGLGRGVAVALAQAGATVVGIARDRGGLSGLHAELGDRVIPVAADAADPVAAGRLIDQYVPRLLVLAAGAAPLSRPLQYQTWQTFSQNWQVDVQQVFHWTREALLRPLAPGSSVIAFSSGAVLAGSPLSGGYAGAKATIRYIMSYAAEESERSGLAVSFSSVLPQLTHMTDLGAAAVSAYAARAGKDVADFIASRGPALTPDIAGKAVLDLATGAHANAGAYLLSAAGLKPLQ
jgi:NAD(P)-dependent dehydrogenase (short-subunit alcohol dehydrogenase family)